MKSNRNYFLIGICVLGLLSVIITVINYNHVEVHDNVVINNVDFQQTIRGGKEGGIQTEYRCVVYTDKGMFEIQQSGFLYAYPSIIGQIHNGDTLSITTRGFEILPLGEYRKIIKIVK